MIHECFRIIDMTGGILNLFPWLRYIIPNLSGYKPLVNAHVPIWTFLREVVQETKAKSPIERPKSFISSYLDELAIKSNEQNAADNSIHESFSGTNQNHIIFNSIIIIII